MWSRPSGSHDSAGDVAVLRDSVTSRVDEELIDRQPAAEEVALEHIATEVADEFECRSIFDALSDNLEAAAADRQS